MDRSEHDRAGVAVERACHFRGIQAERRYPVRRGRVGALSPPKKAVSHPGTDADGERLGDVLHVQLPLGRRTHAAGTANDDGRAERAQKKITQTWLAHAWHHARTATAGPAPAPGRALYLVGQQHPQHARLAAGDSAQHEADARVVDAADAAEREHRATNDPPRTHDQLHEARLHRLPVSARPGSAEAPTPCRRSAFICFILAVRMRVNPHA
eukprot:7378244-Prymnesium_polylepis.3